MGLIYIANKTKNSLDEFFHVVGLMAHSHWRFSQASDFLSSEAIYLDIITLAIFQAIFIFIFYVCL